MLLCSGITEKENVHYLPYHVNKFHPSIWYPDQMTDDPQDSRRPFSLGYPSSSSSEQRHAVFQGQVRAFLEASEIVEMGEEVLDDILDGFDGFDHETSDCVANEQPFVPVRTLVRDAVGNIELPLPHGFYVYFGPQGMPVSVLLSLDICSYIVRILASQYPLPARPHGSSLDKTADQRDACSSQTTRKVLFLRVRAMLTHYCTGLSSFVKEYVVTRAIPIPELLCAFDVYLVGG